MNLYDCLALTFSNKVAEQAGHSIWSLTHMPLVPQELVQHWATKFNWRKQEAYLNSFPQFKLPVNGIDLHFVHLRSAEPDAVPLLLSHGWPGSFFGARCSHTSAAAERRQHGRTLRIGPAMGGLPLRATLHHVQSRQAPVEH